MCVCAVVFNCVTICNKLRLFRKISLKENIFFEEEAEGIFFSPEVKSEKTRFSKQRKGK